MSGEPQQAAIAGDQALQRVEPRFCEQDRTVLKPKQLRFCSGRCRTAWWTERHPRLGTPELPAPDPDGKPLRDRILGLMSDGRWYAVRELALLLGAKEVSVDRKLRDLRRPEYGRFDVQGRRRVGERGFEFRVVRL